MARTNLSTTFTVVINKVDANTELDLEIPDLDLTFHLIKDNTITLYVRSRKEIPRFIF